MGTDEVFLRPYLGMNTAFNRGGDDVLTILNEHVKGMICEGIRCSRAFICVVKESRKPVGSECRHCEVSEEYLETYAYIIEKQKMRWCQSNHIVMALSIRPDLGTP